jgi:hypothetical protein
VAMDLGLRSRRRSSKRTAERFRHRIARAAELSSVSTFSRLRRSLPDTPYCRAIQPATLSGHLTRRWQLGHKGRDLIRLILGQENSSSDARSAQLDPTGEALGRFILLRMVRRLRFDRVLQAVGREPADPWVARRTRDARSRPDRPRSDSCRAWLLPAFTRFVGLPLGPVTDLYNRRNLIPISTDDWRGSLVPFLLFSAVCGALSARFMPRCIPRRRAPCFR